jgi:RNA 2',3'-cyclic 3'-phosphodiesterase
MDGHSKSGAAPERYRLFIAIDLPENVKQAIEKTQQELRASLATKAIRWTRREQFHLTMRFLGSVEALRVDSLNEALRRACMGSGELQLRAARIGVFPGIRRPRVVWAGVDDRAGRLSVLQQTIEAATASFTNEPPQEKFTGHITLARCREITRTDAATLGRLVDTMAARAFGEWTAADVEVIRSQPTSQGSRYTTLASVGLM